MITGPLRSRIDKLWEEFWTGGITNPLTVIEQISFLMFARFLDLRESKLPNETGGVLLGSFDLDAHVAYIADTIPSPPDSEEWPTLYIRGKKGLRPEVDRLAAATDGMLEYIGEWHSHPDGCSTAPSPDDLKVFAWLTEIMSLDAVPATMMIVGDQGRVSFFLGKIAKEEQLLASTEQ